MENGNIGDDQIKASSYLKISTPPQKARLRSNGSWCPLGDKVCYFILAEITKCIANFRAS